MKSNRGIDDRSIARPPYKGPKDEPLPEVTRKKLQEILDRIFGVKEEEQEKNEEPNKSGNDIDSEALTDESRSDT